MKTKILLLIANIMIFVALLLASITLQAGELKFGWNLANEAGGIQDMKFAPNQDQFLVLAGLVNTGVLQLRNTETGELIKSNPIVIGSFSKFDFIHDSSKILITNTIDGELSLYNLHDLSLIKSYILPKDTISTSFSNIVVDPIRPYVYVTKYSERTIPDYVLKGQVSVYNYETMEFVKDLTTYDNTSYVCLAISKDGKYLAAMNKGKTYLKVWDLSTFELKNDFCLYDKNLQNDYSCTPRDLKFSELNTDNIYFCGDFPRLIEDNNLLGLSIYNILENKIIDSTFSTKPKQVYSFGQFAFFDKEERIITPNSIFVNIINLKTKEIEANYNISFELPFSNIKYSKNYNLFLGFYSQYFGMASYKNGSLVKEEIVENKIIYPNPTTNIVNIELNCFELNRFFEIYTSNGIIITKNEIESNTSKFQIDLSNYSNATYYIKVTCGSDVKIYKIVKEN